MKTKCYFSFTALFLFLNFSAQQFNKVQYKGDSVYVYPFPFYTQNFYENPFLETESGGRENRVGGLFVSALKLPDGKWIAWYNDPEKTYTPGATPDALKEKDNTLALIFSCSGGQMNGPAILFSREGKKIAEGNYHNGEKEDTWNIYSINGKILLEKLGYKNGIAQGTWESYKNGKINARNQFKDGQFDGEQCTWYPNGQIHKRKQYTDGLANGKEQEYSATGFLFSESEFKKGQHWGWTRFWSDKGILLNQAHYYEFTDTSACYLKLLKDPHLTDASLLDGPSVTWYTNGKLNNRTWYQLGVQLWGDTTYHENGSISDIKKDSLAGYNKKRVTVERGFYDNGKVLSETLSWDDSVIIHREYQKNGKKSKETVDSRVTSSSKTGPADDLDSSLVSWVQIKELFYSKGLASEEKYYDTLSGTTTTILRNRKGRIRSRSIYTGHHDVYTAYDPRGRISLINYSRYFESMNNRNDWMESHEKGEYYAPNYVDSTVYFKKGIPITGTKQLKIRKKEYLKGELVNGKLNGTWIHYVKEHWVKDYSGKHHFVSKHIAAKAEFVNNKLNGEELIYDYNLECCYGKPSSPLVYLRARYHFNNNIQDGLELSYYPDGTLKDKTYFQDGKSNGPHLYYYPDGHTNDSCTLVNGKLNGVVKSWSKTGVLTRLDEYENGVRHGRTIQYDFNGIKEMEGLYEQGHHTGNWVHYFKSGNPNIRSHYFTPSELDSVRNLLHLQPLKKEKRSADREKKQVKDLATKNLSAVFYYENGQKAQQGCIVEGERKGLWIWWREDGSKEKEISYESGILHPGTADSVHYLGRIVSCYPDGSKMLEALVMDEDMKYDCQKEVYDPIHNLYFLNAWDEKGNPLISNGSGYFKLAGPDKLCPGEGPVKAGLKDGFWQYRDQNAKLNSIGTYRKGLKEGKWMDGDLTGTHTIENACYHNLTEKQMKELLEQLDVTVSWFRQGEVTREEGHSNIKISFSYKRNKLPRWMPSMDEINFNTEIQRTGWRYNELSQMHNSSSHGVLDTTNNDFY